MSKGLTTQSLQNTEIIQFKQFLAILQNLSLLAVQYPSSLQVHSMTLSINEMKPPGRKTSKGNNKTKQCATLQQLYQLQQLTITKAPQFPGFCSLPSSVTKRKKLSRSFIVLIIRKTTKQFYPWLTPDAKYFLVQTQLVDSGIYPLNKVCKSFSQRHTNFSVLHLLDSSRIFCIP